MRRIFISADIEGCAAVASHHALSADRFEWQAARGWMTAEVAAVAKVALAQGFDEVIVGDGHGNAHNILPDLLPDGVRLIRSWPRPLLQMEGIQGPGIEACFFIGYHNGSQGAGGVLAHTYHGGALRDIRLNGVSCSEGYLNAALAGEFRVPVVLVAGDAQTAVDARLYAPQAHHVVVKEAIGHRAQSSLAPRESCRMIEAAAAEALAGKVPTPFRIDGPFELELEMTSRMAAEMLAYLREFELSGPFTARACLPTIADVMRTVSFAIFYSPTGVIAL